MALGGYGDGMGAADPCHSSARRRPFSVAVQSPYWSTAIVQSELGVYALNFDWPSQVKDNK
jgi:hypothetical protein